MHDAHHVSFLWLTAIIFSTRSPYTPHPFNRRSVSKVFIFAFSLLRDTVLLVRNDNSKDGDAFPMV
jgi:hypothetical protein